MKHQEGEPTSEERGEPGVGVEGDSDAVSAGACVRPLATNEEWKVQEESLLGFLVLTGLLPAADPLATSPWVEGRKRELSERDERGAGRNQRSQHLPVASVHRCLVWGSEEERAARRAPRGHPHPQLQWYEEGLRLDWRLPVAAAEAAGGGSLPAAQRPGEGCDTWPH